MNVNRAILIAGSATGLALTLIWLNRSVARHDRDAFTHPTRQPRTAASPADTTPPSPNGIDVGRLLPFSPDQIADAANLACAFTAVYSTYRYDEPPEHFLRRLQPMMSPQLQPFIQRAATDPATLDRRRRLDEVSTAGAEPQAIRTIGPTSITIVITATQQLTTTYATRRETTRYALTLTRSADSWRVYAIELAATGQSGDTGSE